MSVTPDMDRLWQRVFDEDVLSGPEQTELNEWLRGSPEGRAQYLKAAAVHAALARHATAREMLPQAERAPVAKGRARLPQRSVWMMLAGALGVAVLAGWLTLQLMTPAGSPIAKLVEARDLRWAEGTAAFSESAVPVGHLLALEQGSVRLQFQKGAIVTLEAPCEFQVRSAEVVQVTHGRVSVHAPPGAQGFQVETPGGTFVDLGTEFGLAVGSDGRKPVVLTEVFNGEVEVMGAPAPIRLVQGDSRALIQHSGQPELIAQLDEAPIILTNNAVVMPTANHDRAQNNLAAGKPVTSPGFYSKQHGSVFPPERLTDGRINDTGVPGDWSFWLAPNEQNGEFTVDLQQPEKIGRISLQNTNNRGIGDRGVETFEVYGSVDNVNFTLLTTGMLPRIVASKGASFPFHEFTFPGAEARYVKVVVTGHYRHLRRPPTRVDHSGGLNEIRIFAP